MTIDPISEHLQDALNKARSTWFAEAGLQTCLAPGGCRAALRPGGVRGLHCLLDGSRDSRSSRRAVLWRAVAWSARVFTAESRMLYAT